MSQLGQSVRRHPRQGRHRQRRGDHRQGASRPDQPSARDRALIDAVAILYSNADPATHRDRVVKYEAAMAKVSADNPNDVELRIFYALSMSQSARADRQDLRQAASGGGASSSRSSSRCPSIPESPTTSSTPTTRRRWPRRGWSRRAATRRLRPRCRTRFTCHRTRLRASDRGRSRSRPIDDRPRRRGRAMAPGEELHALDYQTYAYLQIAQDKAAKAGPRPRDQRRRRRGRHGGWRGWRRRVRDRGDSCALCARTWRVGRSRRPADAAREDAVYGSHHAFRSRARRGTQRQSRGSGADIEKLAALRDTMKEMQDAYWTEHPRHPAPRRAGVGRVCGGQEG